MGGKHSLSPIKKRKFSFPDTNLQLGDEETPDSSGISSTSETHSVEVSVLGGNVDKRPSSSPAKNRKIQEQAESSVIPSTEGKTRPVKRMDERPSSPPPQKNWRIPFTDHNQPMTGKELLEMTEGTTSVKKNRIIPDNLRNEAKDYLDFIDFSNQILLRQCMEKYPNALLLKLFDIFNPSSGVGRRMLAASVLHEMIPQQGSPCLPGIIFHLKSNFISLLEAEESGPLFELLTTVVSDIAFQVFQTENNDWPELLSFLVSCVDSDIPEQQRSGLFVLHKFPRNVGGFFTPYLETIFLAVLSLLNSKRLEIRTLAYGASVTLMQGLREPTDHSWVNNLLNAMRKSLSDSECKEYKNVIEESLKKLLALLKDEPENFFMQVSSLFELILKITEKNWMSEEARTVAVAIFVVMIEEWKEKIMLKLMNLDTDKFRRFILILLQMISQITDDIRFYTADDGGDGQLQYSGSYIAGMNCLEQITYTLSFNDMVPVTLKLIEQFLAAQEWQRRVAALTCIRIFSPVITNHCEQLMKMVLEASRDPHHRVRFAVVRAISAIMEDSDSELQVKCHNRILPALVAVRQDTENPIMQLQTLQTICKVCQRCTPDDLAPYLSETVVNLFEVLQSENQKLKETALEALASVASSSQDHFKNHYVAAMTHLMILNSYNAHNVTLRAKNFECIGSIAVAVGKEKFKTDAREVIGVITSVLQSKKVTDKQIRLCFLQAVKKFCICLRQDFSSYLEDLMPIFLSSASEQPVGLSENKDCLREKTLACTILYTCARHLKERKKFFPWAVQVAKIFVPLLNYPLESEIRKVSASAMPELLHSAMSRGTKASFQKLVIMIIPELVKALRKEQEKGVLVKMFKSLEKCIQIPGSLFYASQVTLIVYAIKQVLTDHANRKAEFIYLSDEDDTTEEEKVITQMGYFLGTLIDKSTDMVLPYLDHILSHVTQLWSDDNTEKEKAVAFRIFNVVMQKYGESAHRYYSMYLPMLLEACCNKNQDIQQEAVCGIGICAKFGGSNFRDTAEVAIVCLNSILISTNVLSLENAKMHGAAVSALGKICEFQRDCIKTAEVLPIWLSYLPIKNNPVEAQLAHEQLCSMVERLDKDILGPENLNLQKILSVFEEVLPERGNLITEETANRMTDLLKLFR